MENGPTPGRDIRTLADIEGPTDFKVLYKNMNLSRATAKIKYLRENLGILAIRCSKKVRPTILLADLEEYVLTHPWRCK